METQELKIYNDLILELYKKSKGTDTFMKASGPNERFLIELLRDDLCIYANREGLSSSYLVVGISNLGKALIDSLPHDYFQNPYGWFLAQRREREKKENLLKQKNAEKLDYDLKMAKRAYNFYWITFFIAVVGLIVSVISLFLKSK